MFGIDAAEAYGQPLGGVLRLSDAGGERIDMLAAVDGAAGVNRGQAQFDGHSSVKHVAYVSSPIGEQGYVLVLRDVTAQQRLSTQLSYEASHDSLTNTFNRRKFDQLLEDAIDSARRDDGPHALAFLDLDRFKSINDRCGHTVGDRVLLDLANLLQGQLRGRDVLARIGGDEFAVLLHDCTPANARRVLEKLRRAVDNYRVSFGGHEYSVGVSIGITPIDGSERDAGALFARADAACYAAKSSGRNAVAG
jgi:diguanylate cyclase (GGDEF)-like protein